MGLKTGDVGMQLDECSMPKDNRCGFYLRGLKVEFWAKEVIKSRRDCVRELHGRCGKASVYNEKLIPEIKRT